MAAYVSQSVVYGLAYMETQAGAQKVAPANPLVDTAKVRLSTSPAFSPSPGDTVAGNAANEANYSGYAAGGIAVVQTGPVLLSNSAAAMVASALYAATSATPFVEANCYGYWVDDGTNVIMAEKFVGGPIGFAQAGDFLALTLLFPQQCFQQAS